MCPSALRGWWRNRRVFLSEALETRGVAFKIMRRKCHRLFCAKGRRGYRAMGKTPLEDNCGLATSRKHVPRKYLFLVHGKRACSWHFSGAFDSQTSRGPSMVCKTGTAGQATHPHYQFGTTPKRSRGGGLARREYPGRTKPPPLHSTASWGPNPRCAGSRRSRTRRSPCSLLPRFRTRSAGTPRRRWASRSGPRARGRWRFR